MFLGKEIAAHANTNAIKAGFWDFMALLKGPPVLSKTGGSRKQDFVLRKNKTIEWMIPASCFHLLPCETMDYLWTPWRYDFVSKAEKASGCVFCDLPRLEDDAKAGIVYRGVNCFVILNLYPYTSGHVMVVPYAHLDELQKLPTPAAHEMIELSKKMETILRGLYRPDGINLGMNIGKAAGAGIAGHIHMHVLPRWVADASFISVVGETRILPEALEVTYSRIKTALAV